MIIVTPITTFDGSTKWELFDGVDGNTVSPELFPVMFKTKIGRIKENESVFISGLTTFRDDFILLIKSLGYDYTDENKKLCDMSEHETKYLIGGENGTVFNIVVKQKGKKIEFLDADNFFPDRENVMKTWGRHDAQRVARAYFRAFINLFEIIGTPKYTPLTISGASRNYLKKHNPLELMDANKTEIAPGVTLESFCRPSYHGGLCAHKKINYMYPFGIVLDINSLYPYVMRYYPMPYGSPEYHKGAPSKQIIKDTNKGILYFFIHIKASFQLKPGCVPCVRASEVEYLTHNEGWLESSDWVDWETGEVKHRRKNGDLVTCELTLTCTDFTNFIKSYDIEKIEYIDYVTMSTNSYIFKDTIDSLYQIKENSDGGRRKMAKILMNAISGNMARKPDYTNFKFTIDDGHVNYTATKYAGETASYVYIGSAITSYARQILINLIINNYDRWIYSDTDSLHLLGDFIPDGVTISDKLGDFKVEHQFEYACYYKHKMYGFYKKDDGFIFKLAGVPKNDIKEFCKGINEAHLPPGYLMDAKDEYIPVKFKKGVDFHFVYEPGSMTIADIKDMV